MPLILGADLIVHRFWSKVDQSGGPDSCWLWQGGLCKNGYGKFQYCPTGKFPQVHVRAPRFALLLWRHASPLYVLHRCDTPRCCNPKHLFTGTQAVNRADCVAKGRQARGSSHHSVTKPESVPRGERSGMCRLTDDQVREIRRRYVPRVGVGELAREFGVCSSTVSSIAARRYRADVT